MLKKLASLFLLLTLLVPHAFAETTDSLVPGHCLAGTVAEITQEYLLLEGTSLGQVQVNLSETTYFETTQDIACGDFIFVDYNGQSTFSLPPQITAQSVRMYRTEGEIVEYDEDAHAVLLESPQLGEVYAHLPEDFVLDSETVHHLILYFNGVMTASIPGQINVSKALPAYLLQGEVTQINKTFLLLGEGQECVQVNFTEGSLPQCLEIGAVVQVLYNGQMTRSLPPQVTALNIVQLSR